MVKPCVIIEKAGKRIGVFGLLADLKALVAPSTYAELTYLDPIETAKAMVDMLQRQNCDLIVCLSHLGVAENTVNDIEIAEKVKGVDMIIGGHTHTELKEPKLVGNTRIYQRANRGKCVGEIIITY